jgi:cell division protein FtsA
MTKRINPNKNTGGLIAALDLGTTKACCLIAEPKESGLQVVGIGHQAAAGLRAGTIVDMDAAERTIRATVEAAEQMAGTNIREVVVNIGCGAPTSKLIAYDVSVAGHEIGDADLRRILGQAEAAAADPAERDLIHAIPVGYTIDGHRGVRDPRGMVGERLGVNMHLVSAAQGPLRNLVACVQRCHLGIRARVVSPYAAALSCLVEDETQLGVTLLEFGGGSTTIAVFFDGELVHTDAIPLGGINITNDIARGLSTPLAHAERLKTLYGSALPSPSDDRESIRIPLIGEEDDEEEDTRIPRSMLIGIIRPRVEEILEMVRNRLEGAGFAGVAGRRVVLTGGSSQLPGVRELAGLVLDKQVRLGRPKAVNGLAEAVSGAAFATGVGLLAFAQRLPGGTQPKVYRPIEEPSGRWGRFGQWFRENF